MRARWRAGTRSALPANPTGLVQSAARLREVQVDEAPVVRPASCDHHVVDLGRQVPEEALEGSRIRGVEGRGAQRLEFPRGAPQTLGIPPVRITLAPSARARRAVSNPMPPL